MQAKNCPLRGVHACKAKRRPKRMAVARRPKRLKKMFTAANKKKASPQMKRAAIGKISKSKNGAQEVQGGRSEKLLVASGPKRSFGDATRPLSTHANNVPQISTARRRGPAPRRDTATFAGFDMSGGAAGAATSVGGRVSMRLNLDLLSAMAGLCDGVNSVSGHER